MKYMKYFLLTFMMMFIFTLNTYAASSKFEPIIDVETEIIDDRIYIILGCDGEEVLALTQEIGYENKYLELDSITPSLASFEITKGKEKDEGAYNTIKILADSNKIYKETKYAVLAFKIKPAFRVGKIATVFLYNYDSVSPKGEKYRHKGLEISVRRTSGGEVTFLKNYIDGSTKTKQWFKRNYMIFIIIFLIIICVILFIFLIPSTTKKENRAKDLKKKIAKGNETIKPIKLDADMIAKIGEEEKVIDMSEAIEVTDMKPFGEAAGRFDDIGNTSGGIEVNADVFNLEAGGIKDLETETTSDGVEIFDAGDDDDDDNEKIDTLGMFILILITSTLFMGSIKAFGVVEYDVKSLKENIVNDYKYKKELDYNNDGKIDLLDLLETKDLESIEYEGKEYDLPTYEPLD